MFRILMTLKNKKNKNKIKIKPKLCMQNRGRWKGERKETE